MDSHLDFECDQSDSVVISKYMKRHIMFKCRLESSLIEKFSNYDHLMAMLEIMCE